MNARTSFPPASVHAWLADDREDQAIERLRALALQRFEQSSHTVTRAQLTAGVDRATRVLDYITYGLVTALALVFVAFVVLLIRSLTGR